MTRLKRNVLLFVCIVALFLAGCSERRAVATSQALPTTTSPAVAAGEVLATTTASSVVATSTLAPTVPSEPTTPPTPTDTPAPSATPEPTSTPTATPAPSNTPEPTSTLEPTSTPQPTATPAPTETPLPPTATATPDPNYWITTAGLRERTYGGEGQIERVTILEENAQFTRYLIRYPSDGLSIGGFMNVPVGPGPFPVIVVNHGYMPPRQYQTLTYTTKYADALARAGYLVLHPNFRNHAGSDDGPNPFRVGFAIDVLNLIQLAKQLPEARPEAIGLWGHSMGGGITLRVLTVTDEVKAALVYGSMSTDEADNYYAIMEWSGGSAAREGTLPVPPEADPELYARLSPINALHYISAPVAIHHGEMDETVPFDWSVRLRDALQAAGKTIEFYSYPGQPHNFVGAGYDLLIERMVAFYDAHLKAGAS